MLLRRQLFTRTSCYDFLRVGKYMLWLLWYPLIERSATSSLFIILHIFYMLHTNTFVSTWLFFLGRSCPAVGGDSRPKQINDHVSSKGVPRDSHHVRLRDLQWRTHPDYSLATADVFGHKAHSLNCGTSWLLTTTAARKMIT